MYRLGIDPNKDQAAQQIAGATSGAPQTVSGGITFGQPVKAAGTAGATVPASIFGFPVASQPAPKPDQPSIFGLPVADPKPVNPYGDVPPQSPYSPTNPPPPAPGAAPAGAPPAPPPGMFPGHTLPAGGAGLVPVDPNLMATAVDYGSDTNMGKIARQGAYNIGPYNTYAFDAMGRTLGTGYAAADALSQVGNQSVQMGQEFADANVRASRFYGEGSQAAGAQSAAIGADAGRLLGLYANDVAGTAGTMEILGNMAAERNIFDPNMRMSTDMLKSGSTYADKLARVGQQEGPSAAQAQLQSALNQSNAQNLAMARSGRGWGGSASAQSQALAANAAAGQQAANASAMLRAQEAQAAQQLKAQTLGQASQLQQAASAQALQQQQVAGGLALQEAQQQQQAAQNYYGLSLQAQNQGAAQAAQGAQLNLAGQQQNLAALGQGGQLELAGLQQGGQMALGGLQQGADQFTQGAQFAQTGELQAMQFASQQQQALAAQQQQLAQIYGLDLGLAVNNAQMTNQLIGAGIGAIGSVAGAAAMMSDKNAKTDIAPAKDYALDFRPNAQELPDFGLSSAGGPSLAAMPPVGAPMQGPMADFGLSQASNPLMQQPSAGPSPQQAGMANLLKGSAQGIGDKLQQPVGFNPILAQSLQGLGAGGVMSDERRKTDIEQLDEGEFKALQGISAAFGPSPADLGAAQSNALAGLYGPPATAGVNPAQPDTAALDQAANAFDPLKAYSYRYKEPDKFGAGPQVGVMAQDLAKTPAGRTVVSPDQNGMLRVDTPKLTMLNAAAQASTQDRVDDVETQLAELRNMMRARGMSVEAAQ